MNYRYHLRRREHRHRGFFKLDNLELCHELYAGGMGKPLQREVLLRGPVVAVLPYDPELDRCVLIEQFRVGALQQETRPWLVEIVAGIIEPGEDTADVVRRELREETGGEAQVLRQIGRFYSSPGGSSECVTLYCAKVDSSAIAGIHGIADEGEDIRVFSLSRLEAMNWLAQGRIAVAPAIIALQWLAINVDSLRSEWCRR